MKQFFSYQSSPLSNFTSVHRRLWGRGWSEPWSLMTYLCSWKSCEILPLLPFQVLPLSWYPDCSLHLNWWENQGKSLTISMFLWSMLKLHIFSVVIFIFFVFLMFKCSPTLALSFSLLSKVISNRCYFLPVRWCHLHILSYWYFFYQFSLLLPLGLAHFFI